MGEKPGYRITLETGHEIVVSKWQKILVFHEQHGYKYTTVPELLARKDYRIPVFMIDFPRREAEYYVREARLLTSILLSEVERRGTKVKLLPLTRTTSIINMLTDICHIEETGDGVVVDSSCLVISLVPILASNDVNVDTLSKLTTLPLYNTDINRLVTLLPLPLLAETGYFLGVLLFPEARLTSELEKRLPLIALLLQLAGCVVKVEDNVLKTSRDGTPVYYARVLEAREVNDDFYCITPREHHTYIANGLVLSSY